MNLLTKPALSDKYTSRSRNKSAQMSKKLSVVTPPCYTVAQANHDEQTTSMSVYAQLNERQLIQQIIRRDQSALLELYKRHHRLVHNMAFHILREKGMAEEVTQDIFFQIWRWPEKWDPQRGRFTSWMLSVTRYAAIDRLRREKREPVTSGSPLDRVMHLVPQPTGEVTMSKDEIEAMRRLISQLPQSQRQVILLSFYRGMTHSEIAAHLDLPLGTVKSRIRLGLEKLKAGWERIARNPAYES
jgi:RNA polymerase sigma-70 factor (ECF subfamily)